MIWKKKPIKMDEIKKNILDEKEKVISLQTQISDLKIKIEEQKNLLNNIIIDIVSVTTEYNTQNKENDLSK